ncbi:MAG: type II toxin-antitoxin system HicA family toxin [Anaerolineae bacterium]|nr:type II toxin-antitoxin system HicA family toxin [Anaerolineae bacterium]
MTIPLHGAKEIKLGTLSSIYKQACEFISDEDLREHFYSD